MYFEDLRLSEDILDALYDMKFEKCTPIQERCIPLILEGKDVVGIAQTGTGKTAAYLLPLMSILQNKPHDKDRVNCLIMAPTRELAQQIDQALQGFGYYTNISGVAIYGGNDGIILAHSHYPAQPILCWMRLTVCSTWVLPTIS